MAGNWGRGTGCTFADPHSLAVNVINMGDGWAYNNNSSGFAASGMDNVSGAGRLHAHYPSSANLTGPWGWTTRTATISPGVPLVFNTSNGTSPMSAGSIM